MQRDEVINNPLLQNLPKIYYLENGQYKKVVECDKDTFLFDGVTCPFSLDFAEVFKRFR